MKASCYAGIGLGILLAGASAARGGWGDNFETYPPGGGVIGQNGWRGWDGDPTLDGVVVGDFARGGRKSLYVFGATDLVLPFTGYDHGVKVFAMSVYVPADLGGRSHVILLDRYAEHGPKHWTVQCAFDAWEGLVMDEFTGAVLPLRVNEWTSFAVLIDLDNNTKKIYYGGQLLSEDSWTCLGCGGQKEGALNIAALNLYGGGGGGIYVDQLVLADQFIRVPAPTAKGKPKQDRPGADSAVFGRASGANAAILFGDDDEKKCYYTVTAVTNFECDACEYAVGDWATRGSCQGDADCPAAGTKTFGWSGCEDGILDPGLCTYELTSQGKCR